MPRQSTLASRPAPGAGTPSVAVSPATPSETTTRDALPALLVYVVLLLGLPSRLIFAPLGAAGTPAGILAIGLLLWWVASLVVSRDALRRANPVKWLLVVFAVALLVSYLLGMGRPLPNEIEVTSADRALLALCGWCGIAVAMVDGLSSRARLDTVLRLVVAGGAFIATLGMLQFFLNLDLASVIEIPGLTANRDFGEVISRSAFRRVTGTTTHPIEFGVVMASILPLGVHYARMAFRPSARMALWGAVAVMGAAVPLSVARSGVLGCAVALALIYFTWPKRIRIRVLVGLVVGLAVFSVVVPGLLGTIRGLFLNAADDPSTDGRTADYGPTLDYAAHSPVFGRGFGTFLPELYRTLDNQYLAVLVETGVVGIVCTLALFMGSMLVGRTVRRSMVGERDRDLMQSLIAAIAVLVVNAATFDLFGFPMSVGLLFLLIGAVGCLHTLSSPVQVMRQQGVTLRGAAAVGVAALVVAAATGAVVTMARPAYQSEASVLLETPRGVRSPALNTVVQASVAARLVHDVVENDSVKAGLRSSGVPDFDVAVGDGSLMMGTDREGSGPLLRLVTRADTPAAADQGRLDLVAGIAQQLNRIEADASAPPAVRISTVVVSTNPAYQVRGRPTRALAAGAVLLLMVLAAGVHLARRRRPGSTSAVAGPARRKVSR